MDYFPFFIKLNHQKCLVVGAGEVAARKISLLARANANITVVAKSISPAVANMVITHHLTVCEKCFQAEDMIGFQWVAV